MKFDICVFFEALSTKIQPFKTLKGYPLLYIKTYVYI